MVRSTSCREDIHRKHDKVRHQNKHDEQEFILIEEYRCFSQLTGPSTEEGRYRIFREVSPSADVWEHIGMPHCI